MGDSSIHQLLLGNVAEDDLDHIFRLSDALGPHAKEDAEMIFERQD